MKPAPPIDKRRPGVQAGLILMASVVVGLAYNTLNPAGLRWRAPGPEEFAPQARTPAGIYQVTTISARLVAPGAATPGLGSVPPPPPALNRSGGTTASRTTWEKVQPLVERGEVILVDSRPRLTYEAGHIPGAVNLSEKDVILEIAKFAATYPLESRLVVYCSSDTCGTSAKLASLLTGSYGYCDVQYVPGGYLEWLKMRQGASK